MAKLQAQLERLLPIDSTSVEETNDCEMSQKAQERLAIDSQLTRDMQDQLTELTTINVTLQNQCDELTDKLVRREQEISRLSKRLVEDDHDLETQDQTNSKQETSEVRVEQLSTQVNLLNDQVAKYESRLKDATEQIHRNSDIAEKLQYVYDLFECVRRITWN